MSEARTALVTGASRGVGRATAEAFAASGWRVVAGCRDPASARLESNASLRVVRMDVTDHGSVRASVATAEDLGGGRLDCLVNNAGYGVMGAIEDVDLDDTRAMFETNLFGALAATQAAVPGMRRRGSGVVINVSSIGGRITNPLVGVYHASKYALTSVSEALALECRAFGVRVVLIEPGMIDTEFSQGVRASGSVVGPDGPYTDLRDRLGAGFRAWRARSEASPEEVAATIVAAASDPSTPFQVLVGEDAEMLASERRARDDDRFQDYTREFLGL